MIGGNGLHSIYGGVVDDANLRLLRMYRWYGGGYRDELLRINMGLINSQARKYWRYGSFEDEMVYDDFVQEGCIGFLEAIERYREGSVGNGGRVMKFSSYAVIWIKKMILDYIHKNGMTVRYSWRVLRAVDKVRGIIDSFYDEYGGLEVPIDVIVGGSRSIRVGVMELHGGGQYVGLDSVDVEDSEYNEGDAIGEISRCGLLDDSEKKFAIAILGSSEDLKLNYNERRVLSGICDKLAINRLSKGL